MGILPDDNPFETNFFTSGLDIQNSFQPLKQSETIFLDNDLSIKKENFDHSQTIQQFKPKQNQTQNQTQNQNHQQNQHQQNQHQQNQNQQNQHQQNPNEQRLMNLEPTFSVDISPKTRVSNNPKDICVAVHINIPLFKLKQLFGKQKIPDKLLLWSSSHKLTETVKAVSPDGYQVN